jgi:metallo-beta-lactamase family protein
MDLTFLGATGTVTGSRYLVKAGGATLLVDCGLFQGLKQLRLRNREPFPVDVTEIDAVILTHAHLDHSGYLPLLIRNGFSGPVLCTPATRALCEILLPDSGRLQEEDAAYANRHGFSRHSPALPLYTEEDANRALSRLLEVPFLSTRDVAPGVRFTMHPAGHILGAAMVRIETPDGTILFTGDIGRPSDPLMRAPATGLEADWLVAESTYGDRLHGDSDPADSLAEVVSRTAARGGSVLIPSFAVGRAQAIAHLLWRLKRERRIPDIPVYLDSPMAQRAAQVMRDFREETLLSADDEAALQRSIREVETVQESKRLNQMTFPRVIISASGMATGGRVLHHLKTIAPEPRNAIVLAGHQAAGTRGAALRDGAATIKIHGGYFPVRAEVTSLDNISAHADYREILDWIRTLAKPPLRTYLTHGEPVASDAMRHRIEEDLGWDCVVPDYRETVRLVRGEEAADATPPLPRSSAG